MKNTEWFYLQQWRKKREDREKQKKVDKKT